jgi:amino acid transporter
MPGIRAINLLIITSILGLLFVPPAHAYFDVNTGTYLLQFILGFAAVIWLTMKQTWETKFKKKPLPTPDQLEAENQESEPSGTSRS